MTINRETLEEAVLDFSQRKKRALTLRKFASKIQAARKRALKRIASSDSIEKRAHRAAIKIVRKIVAGKLGLDYNNLAISQKMAIDAKVQKRTALIAKISTRLIPKMRKQEVERFQASKKIQEGAGAGEDGTDELVNTYVKDTPHQGNPFLPGMVLDNEYFFAKYGHNAQAVMDEIKSKAMKTSERARKTDDS